MNNANILDSQDLPETLRNDAAIVKAVHELNIMGLVLEEQDIYDKEVLANMLETGVLQYEREEGRQEGREEGRQEGKEETLIRLIRYRFGSVPAAVKAALGRLTPDKLDELATVLFNFTCIEDIEGWLAR